jgi:hypothetical protein
VTAFPTFKIEFISYYWLHNASKIISRTYDPVNNVLDNVPLPIELNTLPNFGSVNFSIPSMRAAGFLTPRDRNISFEFS